MFSLEIDVTKLRATYGDGWRTQLALALHNVAQRVNDGAEMSNRPQHILTLRAGTLGYFTVVDDTPQAPPGKESSSSPPFQRGDQPATR